MRTKKSHQTPPQCCGGGTVTMAIYTRLTSKKFFCSFLVFYYLLWKYKNFLSFLRLISVFPTTYYITFSQKEGH